MHENPACAHTPMLTRSSAPRNAQAVCVGYVLSRRRSGVSAAAGPQGPRAPRAIAVHHHHHHHDDDDRAAVLVHNQTV